MRRVGNLFEKVVTFEQLYEASKTAFVGKKGKSNVARFYFDLERELIRLERDLVEGTYRPSPYGVFKIYEPKEREICSSSVRDRVVHHAICNVLGPIFEKRFIHDTYACRIGKGTHKARERARVYMKQTKGYYLKCDIKKYFYSIDHAILKSLLTRMIKDEKFMDLLSTVIDHQVPGAPLGKGLPIGNLTSQYFANLYLGELDHFVKDRLGVKCYIRYMDDFIIFSSEKGELRDLLHFIDDFIRNSLALELKEKATKLAPVSDGVPFLGFRMFPNLIRLQRPNLIRMRRKIRRKEGKYLSGKITQEALVQAVASLTGYAKHADSMQLRRKLFEGSMQFG